MKTKSLITTVTLALFVAAFTGLAQQKPTASPPSKEKASVTQTPKAQSKEMPPAKKEITTNSTKAKPTMASAPKGEPKKDATKKITKSKSRKRSKKEPKM